MKTEKILRVVYCLTSKLRSKKNNAVMFVSFGGQYNDNPKYISELLHEMNPGISIIWAIADDVSDQPPEYAERVLYKSADYYKFIWNSKVVVDGYMGISSLGFYKSFGNILSWLGHNKNQLCISTWHGTPLKKIGKDMIKNNTTGYAASTSFFVCGSEYTRKCLESAYYLYGKARMYGTPRNDLLFKKVDVDELKQKLRLPNNRIVLYAPTFRDNLEWSGINQLKELDIKMLTKTLTNKFGGDFSFVFRAHRSVIMRMNGEKFEYSEMVLDGNVGDDMAEYLLCTDVLITDYSGSLFDIALTPKPCFLFAPDRDHYEHQERGFYMNYEKLPYPISHNFEELINCIKSYSVEIQDEKRRTFLDYIGNVEDGHASERVVKDIIDYLNKQE